MRFEKQLPQIPTLNAQLKCGIHIPLPFGVDFLGSVEVLWCFFGEQGHFRPFAGSPGHSTAIRSHVIVGGIQHPVSTILRLSRQEA